MREAGPVHDGQGRAQAAGVDVTLHRRTYFVGGFDPRSARHYHRLMRRAAAQRPRDGSQAHVGAREGDAPVWLMRWSDAQATLHTRYTVLDWRDGVRGLWPSGLFGLLASAGRVYGRALPDAAFMRSLWRRARPGLLMGLMPAALLLASAAAGALVGTGAAWAQLPWPAAAALGMGAAWVLARWSAARGRSAWMLGLLDLSERLGRHDAALAAQRNAMAAELVAAAQGGDAQELLLIGHSVGCNWAVAVLAQALRQAPWLGTRGPGLRLVTLGQTLPLSTLRQSAEGLRADVDLLAATPQLIWLDLTAPADWAAFARLPPWHGAPAVGRLAHMVARSPRFHTVLSPARYAALKRDRHALHMQYLRAPDLAGGCDIVALAAGPARLAELP